MQIDLASGCVWANNVRAATDPSGVMGQEVIVMDDPGWLWPGETGFIEYSQGLWGVVIPLWMPAALSAGALLGLRVADKRLRRREMIGYCPACGYDLSGIDGACPECGGKR